MKPPRPRHRQRTSGDTCPCDRYTIHHLTLRTPLINRKQAGKKIKLAQVVAGGFKTLRDQYGVNEVEQSELKFIKKLGEGAFATVEKCVYTPKLSEEEASPKTPQSPMASDCPSSPKPVMREVAVKKLKPEVVKNESDMDSFMAEVALMRKLKHHNIVECEQ